MQRVFLSLSLSLPLALFFNLNEFSCTNFGWCVSLKSFAPTVAKKLNGLFQLNEIEICFKSPNSLSFGYLTYKYATDF